MGGASKVTRLQGYNTQGTWEAWDSGTTEEARGFDYVTAMRAHTRANTPWQNMHNSLPVPMCPMTHVSL